MTEIKKTEIKKSCFEAHLRKKDKSTGSLVKLNERAPHTFLLVSAVVLTFQLL